MIKGKLSIALAFTLGAFAMLASTALASNKYEAPKGPSFGGEQGSNQVFEFGSVKVECEQVEFGGSQPVALTSVEEKLKRYAECKMLGFGPPTVKATTAGCTYKLFEPKGGPTYTAAWTINGSSCEVVFEITAVCTIKFGAQTVEFELEEENDGSATMDVEFKIPSKLTHLIQYHKSGPSCNALSGTDGKYKGVEEIENLVII